jgi:hypothetical protein
VTHTCNPNYSIGGNQEDHGSNTAWQIAHETLSRKNLLQKRTDGVVKGGGPEFKPQYCRKKRKINQSIFCSLSSFQTLLFVSSNTFTYLYYFSPIPLIESLILYCMAFANSYS